MTRHGGKRSDGPKVPRAPPPEPRIVLNRELVFADVQEGRTRLAMALEADDPEILKEVLRLYSGRQFMMWNDAVRELKDPASWRQAATLSSAVAECKAVLQRMKGRKEDTSPTKSTPTLPPVPPSP